MVNPLISSEQPPTETVQYALLNSNQILELYKHITDSYVLDYFTCSHWNKLPASWRSFFADTLPQDLDILLNVNNQSQHHLMPLEMLCLRFLIKQLAIPRTCLKGLSKFDTGSFSTANNQLIDRDKIEKLLWKHVKKKKQHEIRSFAEIIYETTERSNCQFIVDVGSGLGHLDRLLAYYYGLNVCGIESNETLTIHARQLDGAFERQVALYDRNYLISKHAPVHINYLIKPDINRIEFSKLLEEAFGKDVPFGIVGLHPCGDLGPTLLRLYKTCPNIKFINIVGCCYMKLTMDSDLNPCGYPISRFGLQNGFQLSYNAREVACHALESFRERLRADRNWQLKIHSYRAVLEYFIVKEWPELKHSAVANVKYEKNMSFPEYCSKALKNLGVALSEESLHSETAKLFLRDWRSVVTFYSVRLLFAPLIESTILLDRYLYLRETEDGICRLITAFDPLLSPRNHVLLGMREDI